MKRAASRPGLLTEAVQGVKDVLVDTADAARPGRSTKGRRQDGARDGRSARWADHRAARRDELIQAAIETVRQHGAAVGMDQIAASAHTSKPVIYRYFTDKAELYRAIGHQVAVDLLADLADALRSEPDPRARLRSGVEAYLTVLEDSPQLYSFVSQQNAGTSFSSMFGDLITDDLATHMAAVGVAPGGASPWGASIVGFVKAAGEWWIDHPDAMTRIQLTDYLTSLLWSGAVGVYAVAGRVADPTPPAGVFSTVAD